MEELLNKLIEKGWKPFGRNYCKYENWCLYYTVHTEDGVWSEWRYWVSLRELVSKESWLWQFVCENGMVDGVNRWTLNARQKSIYDKFITSEKEYTPKMNYEYRLIESALKEERGLEEFLLNSIKLD